MGGKSDKQLPQGGVQRNHTLDAMRGVASLAVLLFHSTKVLRVDLMPHGYLAVDLFFALSGYVIAQAYDDRLRGDWGASKFAIARIIRFFPLYFLGLAIGLAWEVSLIVTANHFAFAPMQLTMAFMCGLTFLPFPVRDPNLFPLNIPSWSLFFELLVNVGYALLFPMLTRRVVGGLFILAAATLTPFVLAAGAIDLGAHIGHVLPGALRTVASFSAGVLIYRANWAIRGVPAIILLGAVAFLLALPRSLGAGYDLLFAFVVSPLLVMAGVGSAVEGWRVPLFRYLGLISFPIYAVHRPLLSFAQGFAHTLHLPPPLLGGACIVALLCVCPVLGAWYDRPARRWLNARLRSRRDPALMAAP